MIPEEFAEELDLTFEGTDMVVGVEFAEFTDTSGKTRYHLVYPDGDVDTQSLVDVYADGNFAMARTRQGDLEVMVDDDGVHREW